jgi:hypothetical protein
MVFNSVEENSMSKNLKTRFSEQTRVAADTMPPGAPAPGAPPAPAGAPLAPPADDDDEDAAASAMDEDLEGPDALQADDDEGAPDEGEDDFDVDSFDLADLLGDEGEEGDDGDEEDDATAGDVSITHDEDTGNLNIEHQPEDDDAAAALDDDGQMMDTAPAPTAGDDEDEDDEAGDNGDDPMGGMRTYGDDDAPMNGDDNGDDKDDESSDATGGAGDTDDDKPDEDWAEDKVAAAIVDVHLAGGKLSPRSKLVSALRSRKSLLGANFVNSLTPKEYKALAKIMNPLLAEASRVAKEFSKADVEQSKLVASLTKSGKAGDAEKLKREYRDAKTKDLTAAALDFQCPRWLKVKVAAFRAEMSQPAGAGAGAGTPSADFVVAELTAAFVNQKLPKKAARFLLGVSTPDTREAASVLTALFNSGKKDLATKMVRDLRLAAYSANPDTKPTNVDPTVPMRPGSRSLSAPPDAGFSYGLGDDDMKKVLGMLAVEESSSLGWVASLPKDAKGCLDANGRVAVYTDTCGEGPTKDMTFAEAKDFISTKAIRHAAMIADPSTFTEISEDDVVMTLHASASESPFWNVIIGGYPVASVHLSDQEDPETYRSVFVDPETYANGVRQGMARFGVKPTLDKVNARYWVSAYHFSKEMEDARGRMADEQSKLVQSAVAKQAGEFTDLMLLAHEGMRKNFYSIDDPLKWALGERLKLAGVRPEIIETVVEESLNMPLSVEGAAGEKTEKKAAISMYLETLIAKAQEYQQMDPKALEHISKQIVGSPVRLRGGDGILPEDASETLRERLARSSLPLVSTRTWDDAEHLHGKPSARSGREELRARLQIGRRRSDEG